LSEIHRSGNTSERTSFYKFSQESRMLRKAMGFLLVSVSLAVGLGCGTTQSHFVYATIPAANQIVAYREDPNSGVLTAVAGSPFPTGSGPQAVALHPAKTFLYVANSGDNDLSLFTIASGGLTEVTPRTAAGTTPSILAIDAAGTFLYVGNSGSHDLSVFAISSKGALTPVSGSPFPIGMSPLNMKLSPSGKFLYVTGLSQPSGIVVVYSLTAGVPTPIAAVPTGASPLASPFGFVLDSKGSFLYVGNGPPDNSISEFSIASNGSLTPINGSPIGGTLSDPFSLFVDASDKYLFAADEGSGNLAAYSIGSDGVLTLLTNSPFATGSQPSVIAGDPNGKYVLVGMQSGSIQVFGLDSNTGTLTSFATYSTGNGPSSITVLQ
jgi:6-phosphogluconolactonase (cycloisomerase 2 family)